MRGLWFVGVLVLLVCAADSSAAPQKAEQPVCVRANWMWAGQVDEMAVGETCVYAIAGNFVTALSIDTGKQLWEHDYGTGSNPPNTLVTEMAGTLLLARGRALLLIDPRTGTPKHSIEMPGEIEGIEGPPLVIAVHIGEEEELVSIDMATGKELARCGKTCRPELAEFGVFRGVVVTVVDRDPNKVIGLRPADFKQLWKIERERPLSLACSEMGPALFEGTRSEPDGFYLFDPATGTTSMKMPARERESSSMTWSDACSKEPMPTLDFSVAEVGGGERCTLSRFGGTIAEPMWTVDLEGRFDRYACDLDSVYVVTGSLRHPPAGVRWSVQFFYMIDKNTGRIATRALNPLLIGGSVPFVLSRDGSSMISMTGMNDTDILFSISRKEFDPPTALPALVDRLFELADR